MKFKDRVNKLFNPKPTPAFNLYHPEIKDQVEFAFECKGVDYYRMKDEFRMPTGRFKFIDAYIHEHEMRMSLEMMIAYIEKIETAINGLVANLPGNHATNIIVACHNMRTHANLGFNPETIQRLASVVYFDESEDLRDYSPDYGKKKVKDWMEDGKYSFFLTKPIDELLNIRGISITSLQNYIETQSSILKELTSDQRTQSSGNS